jgi:hypothetical protein
MSLLCFFVAVFSGRAGVAQRFLVALINTCVACVACPATSHHTLHGLPTSARCGVGNVLPGLPRADTHCLQRASASPLPACSSRRTPPIAHEPIIIIIISTPIRTRDSPLAANAQHRHGMDARAAILDVAHMVHLGAEAVRANDTRGRSPLPANPTASCGTCFPEPHVCAYETKTEHIIPRDSVQQVPRPSGRRWRCSFGEGRGHLEISFEISPYGVRLLVVFCPTP